MSFGSVYRFRNRQSIRLRHRDYTQPGACFITLCVYDREYLFGEIINGKMLLNEYGKIADNCWRKIPDIRSNVNLDEFIVMPNHIHGIIILKPFFVGAADPVARISDKKEFRIGTEISELEKSAFLINRATESVAPTEFQSKDKEKKNRPNGPKPGSVGAIIGQYKSVVTKQINTARNTVGKDVWQRDYYDHIGRNSREIFRIRQYIRNNPLQWELDEENPVQTPPRYVAMLNSQRQS
jgi:putative transposase